MIWRRYRNEMIIVVSVVLMFAALLFKSSIAGKLDTASAEARSSLAQIGEIIALKRQWGDTGLTKKIIRIRQGIAQEKVKQFSVKSKKLLAVFKGLSDQEVNKIILGVENMAVQITKISVERKNDHYDMEIKCKW